MVSICFRDPHRTVELNSFQQLFASSSLSFYRSVNSSKDERINPSIQPSALPFIHLSIYPSSQYPPIHPSIPSSVHLSIFRSIYLYIISSIHPSVRPLIHLCIHPPIYPSTHLLTHPPPIRSSVHLFIYHFIHVSICCFLVM